MEIQAKQTEELMQVKQLLRETEHNSQVLFGIKYPEVVHLVQVELLLQAAQLVRVRVHWVQVDTFM